jgi:hypothetical protein
VWWIFWWRSAQKEGHFIPEKCVADDREKLKGLRNKSHLPRFEKLLVFRAALSVRSLRMGPLDPRVEGASKDGREGRKYVDIRDKTEAIIGVG